MQPETVRRLLELNRQFYATVAEPFNRTRYGDAPGKVRLIHYLDARYAAAPQSHPSRPLRILDVGCGNGRLAWMLERLGRPVAYLGVDGEGRLLELARENTRELAHVQVEFVAADLAEPDWARSLVAASASHATAQAVNFDAVICLATLQHLPGFELRARVVADFGRLICAGGCVALSAWQFLRSERLAARQLDWDVAHINPAQVEAGDALLPWQQDHYAVRYVHQIDPEEMAQLALDAGLGLESAFYADGKEGNLNYYAILQNINR